MPELKSNGLAASVGANKSFETDNIFNVLLNSGIMFSGKDINKLQKEHEEKIEKQIESQRPFNVAKYQHKLAQILLKEQHEFNLEIHKKQVRWMKFSVCAIIIAAIISGIVGYHLATLENKSRDNQLKLLQKLIQENIYLKESVHHKETIAPQSKEEHMK